MVPVTSLYDDAAELRNDAQRVFDCGWICVVAINEDRNTRFVGHVWSVGGDQVLMALVKVSRFPNGSFTDMSREPQGVSAMSGRA